MRKKPEAPAADVVAEQLESLAVRVQQLEEQLAEFMRKVAANVTLGD